MTDGCVHGKEVVLAGMVDMQVRVQDVAHVAELQPVFLELILDHILMRLHPAHAERFHDLVGAIAGVDQDRPGSAENEEAIDVGTRRVRPQSRPSTRKLEFELDIAVVENLYF